MLIGATETEDITQNEMVTHEWQGRIVARAWQALSADMTHLREWRTGGSPLEDFKEQQKLNCRAKVNTVDEFFTFYGNLESNINCFHVGFSGMCGGVVAVEKAE